MAAHMAELSPDLQAKTTGADDKTARVCQLCLKQTSKYKCPRCSVLYCSLLCYRGRKHAGCSETFYKDHFQEILKEKTGSDEGRRKQMQDILQRVDAEYKPLFDNDENEAAEGADEEDDEEEEDVESLEERIAGLDLDRDTDLIWERLTEHERREFESVLQKGRLGDLVPLWKPWWEKHDQDLIKEIDLEQPTPHQATSTAEKPKVDSYVDEIELDLEKMAEDFGLKSAEDDDETSPEEAASTAASCEPPVVLENVPRLSELLPNKKPSDCVAFNLLNVLYSYAFAVRLYNGAQNDLPVQAVKNVLELSGTLSRSVNFTGTEDAMASAIHNSAQFLMASSELATSVLRDVIHILLGEATDLPVGYTQSALADLHRLFGAAKKMLAKESKHPTNSPNSKSPRETKKQLQKTCFNCQKKVEFFLAWIAENQDRPRMLLIEVQTIYRSQVISDQEHNTTKSAFEKQWGGTKPPAKPKGRLIEELN